MAIITISRGTHSKGKEVAEKLAQKLGYEIISREAILQTSEEFNIPEVMLLQAIHSTPSVFGRFIFGKERYLAFIEAALLTQFRKNNIVYHGFAGHYHVRNVPHALKVRILADMEQRIKAVMERDGCTRKEAIKFLEKIDEERVKWGQYFYGIDISDPLQYDLIINISKLTTDDAVEIIENTVKLETFKTTPASQQFVEDLYLSAKVKLSLVEKYPDAEVYSQNGVVYINVKVTEIKVDRMKKEIEEIEEILKPIPDIKAIEIQRKIGFQHFD
ncbi:MAG: cytidylate kinase-like family protein [Thermodesulfovibrionales bacterium]|nr:cytidylate kinase-like family protein [Thermodesulfovibrionales bacterium]